MTHPDLLPKLVTLAECWQQWTASVEIYATKRWHRRPMDESDYRRIHNRLLQACQSLAEQANPAQRSFYESMEELAKPWLTPRILGRTNNQFLADLLALCRRKEERLTGRRQQRPWKRWVVSVVLFVVVGAVGALVAIGLHNNVRPLWHLHTSPVQQSR